MHIIDNTWVDLILFVSKITDTKLIILVSNLKEISLSVFSWIKQYIKNYDAIPLSKYDSAEKKILNYAYVLINGVSRYKICLSFYSKLAESSVLCRFRVESANVLVCSMCFFFQQTISYMRKRFAEWGHYVGRMNVWILCG